MTDRPVPIPARAGGVRAVLANLGWLLASRSVLAVLSLLYLGIATRTLGLADFGRFALVTGAAQGLALLVGFQTWQVVVRFGIDHRARGDTAALGRLYRASMALDAASALIGLALAAIILLVWRERLGITAPLLRDTIIFTAAQLLSIRSAALGVLRLTDRFRAAAAADSVTPAVRFVGAVTAATFAPTLHAFLWTWTAAELATAAAYWITLHRNGDLALVRHARVRWATLADENPHLLRFLLSSNAVSSLGLATKQVPLMFVGAFGGPAAAGAFRIALQLAQALTKLSQMISRAAFPEVVRTLRDVAPGDLGRALRRMFVASAGGALVILALIAAIGKPVLVAVGGNAVYADAYPLLLWLAAAGSIDLAVVGFEPVLLAGDRSASAMGARALGVAVQFTLMAVLLPRIGADGASIGVFGASLVSALLMIAMVWRYARGAARR